MGAKYEGTSETRHSSKRSAWTETGAIGDCIDIHMSKEDDTGIVRTTIRMNEELARRAKQYAARTRRTFTQVVEEAVTELLARPTRLQLPANTIDFPIVGNPKKRMTEKEYRALIEAMYEEEAEHVMRGAGGHPGR